jgi:hypothetical protein
MCFSLEWLEQICVYAVIIVAIWSIIKLLLPLIGFPLITRILEIVLWAIVAILVIYIIFGLLGCLLHGGVSLLPPHHL